MKKSLKKMLFAGLLALPLVSFAVDNKVVITEDITNPKTTRQFLNETTAFSWTNSQFNYELGLYVQRLGAGFCDFLKTGSLHSSNGFYGGTRRFKMSWTNNVLYTIDFDIELRCNKEEPGIVLYGSGASLLGVGETAVLQAPYAIIKSSDLVFPTQIRPFHLVRPY